MGQRHQAFLIAKVKSHGYSATEAKYRCIAAYHHQWCYGSLPLRAVYRLLALVRQPENAEIIREELRAIDGKQELSDVPCPFSATILGAAWDIDLAKRDVLLSGVSLENSLLPADMGSWDGDNNDGITVIDVTNPEDPAYCFVNKTCPLTGEEYIGGYYNIRRMRAEYAPVPIDSISATPSDGDDGAPQPADTNAAGASGDNVSQEDERNGQEPAEIATRQRAAEAKARREFETAVLESVIRLEKERLLPYAALCEAWPHEYPLKPETLLAQTATTTEGNPIPTALPSLVDISFRQTIEQFLESNDLAELADLPMFFEKMHIVDDVLSKLLPPPDSATPLVVKLAESRYHDCSLDLSGYTFTDAQVLAVATTLPGLRSLNLSRNSILTVKGVHDILANVPSLRRLVLMNCPNIPDSDLELLARSEPSVFQNLDAIHHPAFMKLNTRREEEEPQARLPAGISILFDKRYFMEGVTLPFLNPRVVVAGLADLAVAKLDPCFDVYAFGSSGARALQVAFATEPRGETRPWAERAVVMPLPLDKAVLDNSTGGWALVLSTSIVDYETVWYAFLRTPKVDMPVPAKVNAGDKDDENQEDTFAVESTPDASNVLRPAGDDMSRAVQDESQRYPKSFKLRWGSQSELHDLRSFLDTTKAEGYPAVPEETAHKLLATMEKAKFRVLEPQNVFNLDAMFGF